jgi:hypothetical protein
MSKKLFTFFGSPCSKTSDKDLVGYAIPVDSILRILDYIPAEGENPHLQTEIIFFNEHLDNSPIHVYTTGRVIDIALEINDFEND